MRSTLSTLSKIALMPALLCGALSAHAAGNDAYAGIALGPSELDINCSYTTSCDSGDTGFKFYVGFDLPRAPLPRLAFEAAYIDFGKAAANATSFVQHTVEASAVVFDLAIRGNIVPSLTAVGRLGLAYVSAKSTGTVPFVVAASSDSGLEPHLGLGLELALNKQFKVTGGLDFTSYDTGKESGSARLFSLGVQMAF